MKQLLTFTLFLTSLTLFSCQPSNINSTPDNKTNELSNGLIAYFPFNGSTNDESPNKLNVTNDGATLTKDRNGIDNKAYSFDGEKSSIKVDLDINHEKFKELTISAWVKSSDKFQKRMAVVSNDDGDFDRTLGIDERGESESWSVFGGNCEVVSGDIITPNQWTFLAVKYSQNNQSIDFFVNNKKISKTGCEVGNSEHNFFNIGRNPSFPEFFKGDIDEVRIYNRSLSDEEIKSLYSMN